MSVAPWYTRRWKQERAGTRSRVGVLLYFTAAVTNLMMAAITTLGPTFRGMLILTSAFFLYLGLTLAATIVYWQRGDR